MWTLKRLAGLELRHSQAATFKTAWRRAAVRPGPCRHDQRRHDFRHVSHLHRDWFIPALVCTGSRVVLTDNLAANESKGVVKVLRGAGHRFMLRPIHSPDFGPLEWVFGHLDKCPRLCAGPIVSSAAEIVCTSVNDSVSECLALKYMSEWDEARSVDGSQTCGVKRH